LSRVIKDYISKDMALESLFVEECSSFPIDGWILIDPERPYHFGQDLFLFKYKQTHSTDFKLFEKNGIISLCVIDGGQYFPVQSPANIPAEFLDSIKISDVKMLVGRVVECSWVENKSFWSPIKIRWDKDLPNNLSTYNKTMMNIREQIKPTEMFKMLSAS
jgi:hypothetical protein